VVFVEEGYETLEFHYPRLRLQEAGYRVEVVSPEKGKTYKDKMGSYPAKVCQRQEGFPTLLQARKTPHLFLCAMGTPELPLRSV